MKPGKVDRLVTSTIHGILISLALWFARKVAQRDVVVILGLSDDEVPLFLLPDTHQSEEDTNDLLQQVLRAAELNSYGNN